MDYVRIILYIIFRNSVTWNVFHQTVDKCFCVPASVIGRPGGKITNTSQPTVVIATWFGYQDTV